MVRDNAEKLLAEILSPLSPQDFYQAMGRLPLVSMGGPRHSRRLLFGVDPRATLLNGFATHASQLDCHSPAAAGPPPAPRAVDDPEGFRKLIKAYHDRSYTVRVPDVGPLSPQLQKLTRALECIIAQPVEASLFWSRAGAKAVVHYDNRDNIIIQLDGRKRWFISTDPPGLQNDWKQVGEGVPSVERHRIVDMAPGDLIYLPRGLPHTVYGETESLHLAILFTPITLRATIIAALDHLSDLDRSFRETAIAPGDDTDPQSVLLEGIARLQAHCRSAAFVQDAMNLRAARVVGGLPPLPKAGSAPALSVDTLVRHAPLSVSHVRTSFGTLDFAQPGGHIAVHPGAERELRFIAATPTFRVGDLPGDTAHEVRVALVGKLVASGFLEVVPSGPGLAA